MQALVHELLEKQLEELAPRPPKISEKPKGTDNMSAKHNSSTTSSGSNTGSSSLHTSGSSVDYIDVKPPEVVLRHPRIRPKKPTKKFFTPFESLGIEVDSLNSVRNHLFYANVETRNPDHVPDLINMKTGLVEQVRVENLDEEVKPDDDDDRNYSICMDFERALVPVATNEQRERIRSRKVYKPLPLFVNSKKQPKYTKSGYVFQRFSGTIKLEHSGLPESELTTEDSTEGHLQKEPTEVCPEVEREIIFEGTALHEKKMNVELLSVDNDDFLKIKIADAKLEGEYSQLMVLLKAYYGTVLADPKKERIPADRIQARMLVVAYVFPGTSHAKFIRAKVMDTKEVIVKGTPGLVLAILDVDDGSTYLVPQQNVFYIDEEFLSLPFKVQKCKLGNLQFFHGTGVIRKRFRKFVKDVKYFRAVVRTVPGTDSADINLFVGPEDNLDPINWLFFQDLIAYVKPVIFADEHTKVELCHCDSNGNAWFRVQHDVLPKILSFGTHLGGIEAKLRKCTVSSIADDLLHGELHVAKSKTDDAFYRVEVINFSAEQNQVLVEFVDWGKRETVIADEIYRASDVDANLNKIPPQALKVRVDCFKDKDPKMLLKMFDGIPIFIRIQDRPSNSGPRRIETCEGFVRKGETSVPLESYLKHHQLNQDRGSHKNSERRSSCGKSN